VYRKTDVVRQRKRCPVKLLSSAFLRARAGNSGLLAGGAEAVERIFDSFYTTKQKGLGMGLSICRSIIQAHNGALTVVDSSDLGTRFRVTLPVDAV
jgi:light-regulated signal transduction histidine kinase (bacteriophytochrome)